MPRKLYVCRHAEREDNINHTWQSRYPTFTHDNPPISDRGRSQAKDLSKFFEKINIGNLYASPFDRTMETATILLADRDIKINVEPGLAEALYLCCEPPGFWDLDELAEKFKKVDLDYKPVCPTPLPDESSGDRACIERVTKAVKGIIARDKSENIVFVGHGASIAGVHHALGQPFTHVGQATISLFEEDTKTGEFKIITSGNSDHLSKENRTNLRAY